MTTNPIPIIELNQTDPKKRGQVYGEAARERIHAILDKYHEIFQCITGETWEKTVAASCHLPVHHHESGPQTNPLHAGQSLAGREPHPGAGFISFLTP